MSEPSVPRFTYRAFISYSHRDKAWADWLHKVLETWRAPARLVGQHTPHGEIPRRLGPIFRDRAELASANDLSCEIEAALARSECLIVICSPDAAASRWVNAEVLAFKRSGRGQRILCLIVDGEPNATDAPTDAGAECFCPALRFKLDATGQPSAEPTEPIAADVRDGHDRKTDAKLKLVAGILGIGFDALKQREQHRRLQRMAVVTGAALVAMAITSLLAVSALISREAAIAARQQAVAAQQQAVAAKQTAERRQKQAENLVGFMLGDLYDQLDSMQRLDIMQHVNDEAMRYFESLPSSDLGATALAQRAKALEQIGIVRMNAGSLAGALEAFRASSHITLKLADAVPDDAERQVAASRTLAFIGMMHWKQSRLSEAQLAFEQTRPALQKLAAQPHAPASVLGQLALLDNNLGHVLEARGDAEAAAAYYRERLQLATRVVASEPDEGDYLADLGSAHNDLGRLALQRGDLLGAIAEYHARSVIATRLANADRNDNLQRQSMLEARAILGRTLALAGAAGPAIEQLTDAVGTAGELVKFEPANTEFRLDLALYSTQLARLKRLGGDAAAARTLNDRAVQILTALTHQDPANTEWRTFAAAANLEHAAQAYTAGRARAALQQAQAVAAQLQPLLDARPGDRDLLLLTLTAQLQIAAAAPATSSARDQAGTALALIETQQNAAGDPRVLALKLEALLETDDQPAARALARQLWQTGYRDGALLAVLQRAGITYPRNPQIEASLSTLVDSTVAAPANTQRQSEQHPQGAPASR
jgi:tetratricopeptide (TPR) repeat protein